jgi:hypothetical protein
VVGYALTSAYICDAFLYRSATSTLYDLARPTGFGYDGQNYECIADALSPSGAYLVGSITFCDTVGTPPALPQRRAAYWTYSINGSGVMTSTVTDLHAALGLPGGSSVVAVNNSGQMVGFMNGSATAEQGANQDVYFYHFGDASYTNLTALGLKEPFTGGKTGASGSNLINNNGQVVGETSVSGVYHAAIWDSTNGLRDLNTLYAADLAAWSTTNGGATVVLNDASGINDKGAIIGTATINGTANQVFVLTPPAVLAGDANLDGTVNIADLSKVLTNYDKTSMVWADGDFNGDGTVNISDLSNVLTNYDKSATAAGIRAVPEPSMLALAAAGMAGLLACAWRRRVH